MLPYATPNGKHHRPNALRLVEATGETLKVSPIAPAPCAQGTPLRTVSRTMPRRKPGPIQVRHSSPFRRHFVTEPAGQGNPISGQTLAAASVAVTTRFFTIVHQQAPRRSKTGREFGHSAAMSKLFSARFRRLLRKRLSRGESFAFAGSGGERARTVDLLLAKQALSQLSYTPV